MVVELLLRFVLAMWGGRGLFNSLSKVFNWGGRGGSGEWDVRGNCARGMAERRGQPERWGGGIAFRISSACATSLSPPGVNWPL